MESKGMSRRQFLKTAGLTGLTALLGGCSDKVRTLIPFVTAPEDLVPGESTWYATTCRECPAGCGMLAKNRDGRIIKVEGNPLHPVNSGKLCPRGQATVQGIYNPDRFRGPLIRSKTGKLTATTWAEAQQAVVNAISSTSGSKRKKNVIFISDLVTGIERDAITDFLSSSGMKGNHLMYEPFAYEALRQANSTIFGVNAIPSYRIDKSDLLISFSANFLETWVSNVHFARQFAAFRHPGNNGKHPFFYVGPRLSVTGANADHWINVPPGEQVTFALGMIRMLTHSKSGLNNENGSLRYMASEFTPQVVGSRTGINGTTLKQICNAFEKAKQPLVLAEGLGYEDSRPFDTAKAANILCRIGGAPEKNIDLSVHSSLSDVARASDMKKLADRMEAGEIDVVFILRANPAYNLPPQWKFENALKSIPLVVSLSSFPDETTESAHYVLPTNTFLEDWGDYSPWTGVRGLIQPVMGSPFDTKPVITILNSISRAVRGQGAGEQKDPFEILKKSLRTHNVSKERTSRWQKALAEGGIWESRAEASRPNRYPSLAIRKFATPDTASTSAVQKLSLVSYPTIQFFDGRTANRPFLQELPDPLTAITWDGWVEIHPDTAAKLGVKRGDILKLQSDSGSIEAPAYPWSGVQLHTLAMPIGHGRRTFGRFASSMTGNGMNLFNTVINESGSVRSNLIVQAAKTGKSILFAHTDGTTSQDGRDIVRSLPWQTYASIPRKSPDVKLPLPQGYKAERDFYPPHKHDEYRWCMVVDLDRCIGCGACVVACYAENNVAVVGRKQVIKGREMAWLHIQRYYETSEPLVRFLPMLCQHCDEAPCESVCPVFAPHHSKEGINNQVYNRCIGTRFCNQNCPYKVRRFNWFTWKHDRPLQWQLNPDVTVRTKGVMEKCSFCIQRVTAGRIKARGENRLIRDGEVTPACAQTCPADALIFGNLKDPASRVARMVNDSRAYQALGELNTKPGIIYLKKIRQSLISKTVGEI